MVNIIKCIGMSVTRTYEELDIGIECRAKLTVMLFLEEISALPC
jgi:hypothetical protein